MGCSYFVDPGKIKGQMRATTRIKQVVEQGFVENLDPVFSASDDRKHGVEEQNKVSSFHVKEPFDFALGRTRWAGKKPNFATVEVENAENKADLLKLVRVLDTLKDE